MAESNSVCPELAVSGGWNCYNETGFFPDPTITISCFEDGYLDGKYWQRNSPIILLIYNYYLLNFLVIRQHFIFYILYYKTLGQRSIPREPFRPGTLPYPRGDDDKSVHSHYHNHQHFHHPSDPASPRSISISRPDDIPAYHVKSSPDVVEATFIFPNKRDGHIKNHDPFHKLGITGLNFSSPLIVPDVHYSTAAKRSISIGTGQNTTDDVMREINGFITNQMYYNKSKIEETIESNTDET